MRFLKLLNVTVVTARVWLIKMKILNALVWNLELKQVVIVDVKDIIRMRGDLDEL